MLTLSRLRVNFPKINSVLVITQGLQMLLADLLSQKLENSKKVDMQRLFKMAFWGLGIGAPVSHYYYAHFLTQSFNYPGAKGFIAKLLFDQIVYAPIICYIFLNYMAAFEDINIFKNLKNTLKKMPQMMLANWKLWPICTILQLLFFGVHTATIFGMFVGFIWGIYLSITENRKKKGDGKEDKTNKV